MSNTRCTIYQHVVSGGPFCDCGGVITSVDNGATTVAVNADALLALLKETSQEFRDWLLTLEEVGVDG